MLSAILHKMPGDWPFRSEASLASTTNVSCGRWSESQTAGASAPAGFRSGKVFLSAVALAATVLSWLRNENES